MSLNPSVEKTATDYYGHWTPDPSGNGYYFVTASGRSHTFDPSASKTHLGKVGVLKEPVSFSVTPISFGAAETASFPPVVTPPPGLTLIQPINVAESNRTWANFEISSSPAPQRAILVNGHWVNLTFQNADVHGGRLCHVYGSGTDPNQWPTNVKILGVHTHSMTEDLWHIDGANGLEFDAACSWSDPLVTGDQHVDGVQVEAGINITIRGNFTAPTSDPRDGDRGDGKGGGGAIFVNPAGSKTLYNVVIDKPSGHDWQFGRFLQVLQTSCRIISPDVVNCGVPGVSPPVTLQAPRSWPGDPLGGRIFLEPAATGIWKNGVQRNTILFNDFSGPGFPSYVTVVNP